MHEVFLFNGWAVLRVFSLFALFGREPESTPGRNLYMQIYMYTHIPIHRYAYIHIYIFMREGGREKYCGGSKP